ncbi:MAG TPA: PTS sugar transporter subunit IIA [Kiritimatiellia bacterium]|nr:PTS sugar transporter subunit IIA [Kiritimatiellia bacterium]
MPSLEQGLVNGGVFYRIEGTNPPSVLKAVVNLLRLPDSTDRDFLFQAMLAREALQSTGIGDGIAVPHVRNPLIIEVDKPLVCLCFLEKPVDFQALDGKPVFVLFTLVTPSVRAHLHLLSRLSFCLRDPTFKELLLRQASRDEILDAVRRIEGLLSAPAPVQEPTL